MNALKEGQSYLVWAQKNHSGVTSFTLKLNTGKVVASAATGMLEEHPLAYETMTVKTVNHSQARVNASGHRRAWVCECALGKGMVLWVAAGQRRDQSVLQFTNLGRGVNKGRTTQRPQHLQQPQ